MVHKENSHSGLSRCPEGHVYSHRRHGQLCPICRSVLEGDIRLIPMNKKLIPPKPVVAWLVCLFGASQGQDYRIVMEKNFIGSADNMHIKILGDDQIKKQNHGMIAYDPLNKKMMLVPQSGSMLLNNQAVLNPTELNDDDKITIGRSLFKLVFFCNEYIMWEERLGKMRFALNKSVMNELIMPLGPAKSDAPDKSDGADKSDKPNKSNESDKTDNPDKSDESDESNTQDKKESDLVATPKNENDPYPAEGSYIDIDEKKSTFPI